MGNGRSIYLSDVHICPQLLLTSGSAPTDSHMLCCEDQLWCPKNKWAWHSLEEHCQQLQQRSVSPWLWDFTWRKRERENDRRGMNFPSDQQMAEQWACTAWWKETGKARSYRIISAFGVSFLFKSKTCMCFQWTLIGRKDKWMSY